jgi:hypothetical protein
MIHIHYLRESPSVSTSSAKISTASSQSRMFVSVQHRFLSQKGTVSRDFSLNCSNPTPDDGYSPILKFFKICIVIEGSLSINDITDRFVVDAVEESKYAISSVFLKKSKLQKKQRVCELKKSVRK